jgi:hypothetical protein
MTFSLQLYLIVTTEFKMIFLNENCQLIRTLDTSAIRLVNFVYFDDQNNRLLTAGIDGVNLFDLFY